MAELLALHGEPAAAVTRDGERGGWSLRSRNTMPVGGHHGLRGVLVSVTSP